MGLLSLSEPELMPNYLINGIECVELVKIFDQFVFLLAVQFDDIALRKLTPGCFYSPDGVPSRWVKVSTFRRISPVISRPLSMPVCRASVKGSPFLNARVMASLMPPLVETLSKHPSAAMLWC